LAACGSQPNGKVTTALIFCDIAKERWRELCAQVEKEQDLGKLLELIEELNHLLDEKQARLKSDLPPQGETS
jgi:hypothetical protein